mmetsp:Transcript_531/g.1003  ORF Transcript_531/g.1003 Transcript_531/m.1003 type:complete len:276 (+) Transcript_531:203-1030(+)
MTMIDLTIIVRQSQIVAAPGGQEHEQKIVGRRQNLAVLVVAATGRYRRFVVVVVVLERQSRRNPIKLFACRVAQMAPLLSASFGQPRITFVGTDKVQSTPNAILFRRLGKPPDQFAIHGIVPVIVIDHFGILVGSSVGNHFHHVRFLIRSNVVVVAVAVRFVGLLLLLFEKSSKDHGTTPRFERVRVDRGDLNVISAADFARFGNGNGNPVAPMGRRRRGRVAAVLVVVCLVLRRGIICWLLLCGGGTNVGQTDIFWLQRRRIGRRRHAVNGSSW